LIETNLDDMTPEGLGYLLERLMAAEALDVYFTPIQMKKNRPATKLSVLARPQDEARLVGLIMAESSTFGVRCARFSRYMAGREFRQIETADGPAQLKLKIVAGQVVEAVPEYESVAALARRSGRPWREIYDEIKQTFQP
jgi:pyridinium-3,5-bisthiocarboxylic acid mononucleotide nickel chelatase